MNVLYFSNYCRTSEKIISQLSLSNSLSIIHKFVCVDNWQGNGIRQDLVHQVTRVPIVFSPDHQGPLTDDILNHWLDYKIKQKKPVPKRSNIPTTINARPQAQKDIKKELPFEAIGGSRIKVDKTNNDGFLPSIQISNSIPNTVSFSKVPTNNNIHSMPKNSIDALKAKRDSESLSFLNNR